MTRFVAALLAVTLAASAAKADLPPPMGEKYVSVNTEVILSKDVTGYVFVLEENHGLGSTCSKLELPAGKAVAIPGGKLGTTLFAVPEAAAKEFKTDKELCDALEKGTVRGVQNIWFAGRTTVSRLAIRNSVKRTTTITGIDATGIKMKVEGEGYEPPAPEKNDKPRARGVPCAAVGAMALAVMFGGLWLVRRARKVT